MKGEGSYLANEPMTEKTEPHPLPPFAPANARLLMLGSFPPPRGRWKMDFYYPNIQNDMWRIFGLVFFDDRDRFVSADGKGYREADIRAFLAAKGIAISNVKDLVNEYNETSDFLRENKSLGKGVQQLTTEFSDTTYKADSYAKMGITVDAKTGKMSVNESRLARALTDSPAQSEAILGKGGLAGRADRHAQYAQMARSRVIPSMEQAIGSQLNYAANMLNGRSLPTMQRYSNILNLFSIYV